MTLETIALTPNIGTEIKADRELLLSGRAAREIRKLAHERGVVLFRQVDMDDAELRAFTATLGRLGPDYSPPEMLEVILKVPEYEKGAFLWHIDAITEELPSAATVISARQLAPTGGHNEWASTVAAYDDLPASEKTALEKLRVVHSFEWLQRARSCRSRAMRNC